MLYQYGIRKAGGGAVFGGVTCDLRLDHADATAYQFLLSVRCRGWRLLIFCSAFCSACLAKLA